MERRVFACTGVFSFITLLREGNCYSVGAGRSSLVFSLNTV